MLKRFWNDDRGVIITIELALIYAALLLSILAGLSTLAEATNDMLAEWGESLGCLDQSYTIASEISCCGTLNTGSNSVDPDGEQYDVSCAVLAEVCVIDVVACNDAP